jgi:hypothetical protein
VVGTGRTGTVEWVGRSFDRIRLPTTTVNRNMHMTQAGSSYFTGEILVFDVN